MTEIVHSENGVLVPSPGRQGPQKFTGKFNRANFMGQSLIRADFRGASLCEANFTGADLSGANFEGANCWGAIFTDAILHRTNFRDAILANAYMDARDMFGMTVTLSCDTFNQVRVGRLWWAWIFFGTMMRGPDELAGDKLIALLGKDRYVKYMAHFQNREL